MSERLQIPPASVRHSNLTDGEVNYLLSLCNSIDQDQKNLGMNEEQNMNQHWLSIIVHDSMHIKRDSQNSFPWKFSLKCMEYPPKAFDKLDTRTALDKRLHLFFLLI